MADAHDRRLRILRWLIGFTVLSTVLHYTHNFVAIEDYPTTSFPTNTVTQIGVLTVWPLLTAIGLWGYRRYAARDYRRAHPALITYSFIGWLTLGHFTAGNPDIPPFWYATIFTDAIAAAALTSFVMWSSRAVSAPVGEPAA
jgi:hypothetical protein